ncbi:receptor activity-modifying protein 1 isoform X2 [Nyctibius grandis]|uniref:receptor activity-modifying protein 1 isoform X2 n=1 Tax=Nyctibius grandis TaxID=48427 RepID=UPI0035BBD451
MALLPRRFLCFVLAHHFIAATACQEADYGWMIRHYCLKQFQLSMEGIGQQLWCDWDETLGDKMDGKKREWEDCGRFSGSEKPHLVLKNVQGCRRRSSPRLPWGSPWDLSSSVDTFGGSIQMWSRCGADLAFDPGLVQA